MQVKDIIHGFEITRVRSFPELSGRLWEMEHRKTGALLCWLDRPDENKAFSIAFKTIPEDSTGVFHILEHSVLCGSDKYPVKEPFVELLKTSVQTFLNAMTYPDKTVYPVSSRNDKDLLNLMDIYLDAVFHPALYYKPEIFRQEGWRFEGEGEELCFQGVVLNEMKGAFASPDRVLEEEVERALFPDNCYRHCSGGDPACITDLTYEQFVANHRKYYHPSNARISLVGSVDLDSALEKIDGFISQYEKQEARFDIPFQAPCPAVEKTVSYEIGPNEPTEHRTMITCAALLGRYDESVKNYAVSVLSDYLTGDDDAPLKRAVLDQGLAQDMSVSLNDGIQQSVVGWNVMNTDAEKLPEIRRLIQETLSTMVREGLDRERLTACFRNYAFQQRDRDSGFAPRSLTEAVEMLDSWLYGGDPAEGLIVEDTLTELEAKLHTNYFEDLIRTYFLENEHTVTVILTPSAELGEEKARKERERLEKKTGGWTDDDRAIQAERAEALCLWQQTPDSEEALSSIPMLQLSDLDSELKVTMPAETRRGEVTVLRHELASRLVYLKAYFNAAELKLEELPNLTILSRMLGSMGTKRFNRSRLPQEIKKTIGRLDFAANIVSGSTPDKAGLNLLASVVCNQEQAEAAADLLCEILTGTEWKDLSLLRDVLQQMAMGLQLSLPSRGHQYGVTRVASDLTAAGAAREYSSGLEFVRRVKMLSTADDEQLQQLLMELEALNRRLIQRSGLILSVSSNTEESVIDRLISWIPASDRESAAETSYQLPGARQEGVTIPAAVGFAITGTNLRLHGLEYTGSIPVLANVLNYVYLWNEIRVQGGAYGCGFSGRTDGEIFFYTYRDPQPGRSLAVFDQSAAFVRTFCAENPDLTGFILGAVSTLDPLVSEEMRMALEAKRWFSGIGREQILKRYQELIHTTPADLIALCEALEALTKDQAVCVVAGKAQLDACGSRLTETVTV